MGTGGVLTQPVVIQEGSPGEALAELRLKLPAEKGGGKKAQAPLGASRSLDWKGLGVCP